MASKSPSPEISKLQKKYDAEPDSLIFARLADAYLSKGEIEQAIKIAEKGVQKHPDYISGLMVLGKCYEKNGEDDKALDIYLTVLEKDRENLLALQKVAKGTYKSGRYEKALESYKKLLDLSPFDPSIEQIIAEIKDIIQKKNIRDQMRHQMEESEQHSEKTVKASEELVLAVEETEKNKDELSIDLELPIEKTLQIDEIFKEEEEVKVDGLPGDSLMEQSGDGILLDLEVEMLEKELENSIDEDREKTSIPESSEKKDVQPQVIQDTVISKTSVEEEFFSKPDKEEGEESKEEKKIEDEKIEENREDVPLYKGEIESVTMANIYEKQGKYEKALSIFEKLLPDHPELSQDVNRVKNLISQIQGKNIQEELGVNSKVESNVMDLKDDTYKETEEENLDLLKKEEDFFDLGETEEEKVKTEKAIEDTDGLLFSQMASESLEELKKIEEHMAILVPEKEKEEKEDSQKEERQESKYNQDGIEAFKKWLDQIE